MILLNCFTNFTLPHFYDTLISNNTQIVKNEVEKKAFRKPLIGLKEGAYVEGVKFKNSEIGIVTADFLTSVNVNHS